jgi:hypothetical protein
MIVFSFILIKIVIKFKILKILVIRIFNLLIKINPYQINLKCMDVECGLMV